MQLIDDDIDFQAYQAEEEHHKVKAASDYASEVDRRLAGDIHGTRTITPWPMLNQNFRLREGELTIWTGYKGHGKTTALQQLCLDGVAQGQKLLILSMEFAPAETIKKAMCQCAMTYPPNPEYRKHWFKWTDGKIWLYDHKGSVTPDKVIGVIRYAVEKFGITTVIVDSLMKCGMGPDNYEAQKDFVDRLQTICHQKNTAIHLVAHARKKDDDTKPAQMHDIKGTSEICDMAENVISFWRNKPKEKDKTLAIGSRKGLDEQPDAVLVVEAQRNGTGWIGAIPLVWHPVAMQYLQSHHDAPCDFSQVRNACPV